MAINHTKKNASFFQGLTGIFWFAMLYIGFPISSILQWLHWEINGKGPRKKCSKQ